MTFLRQNAGTFATILVSVVTSLVAFSYMAGGLHKQADTDSAAIAAAEPRIRYMELHGHEEHERRIAALESQKADLMGERLNTLASAVATLATTVATDHDSVVKLSAILERQDKK